jgi:GDP-L-fucose synthase
MRFNEEDGIMIMNKTDKILVTGASGVLGSALSKKLTEENFTNVVLLTSDKCNLMDFQETLAFFQREKPDFVFHLAGYVNGIMGNLKNKGLAFYNNILINTHTVEASRLVGVKKIIAMGTVAAYPDLREIPSYKEDMIWSGYPHQSEDSYAHAKRALLAQLISYKESYDMDYSFAISTNLYGPHDRFDIHFGHVIPSLVAKFYQAGVHGGDVNVWGDGSAVRDFLYSEDAATALIKIADSFSGAINLATGKTHTIREVVSCLCKSSGVSADRVRWDSSMPNGQIFRAYDTHNLKSIEFEPEYSLVNGINTTYKWYEKNVNTART